MTEKTKSKPATKKAVETKNEKVTQPVQEKETAKPVTQEKPEPKAEIKAEPKPTQPKEKDIGIDIGSKNGVSVESKDDKIIVSFPNRTDISYGFSERNTGLKGTVAGYSDETAENKLHEKEKLQRVSVAYNKADITPETIEKFKACIDAARQNNSEKMAERDAAMAYFSNQAEGKNIKAFGVPFKVETGDNDTKTVKPSYFNGDVVKAGKHLVAAIEGSTNDAMYVRLIETTKFPLTVQDYTDRQTAVRNHLGIKAENVDAQGVVHGAKRHIAFGSDWNISKINEYTPKQEHDKSQVQAKPKNKVQTLAQ